MIEFSSQHKIIFMKYCGVISFIAALMFSIVCLSKGETKNAVLVGLFFIAMGLLSLWVYSQNFIKVQLNDKFLKVDYPAKNKSISLSLQDIENIVINDFDFSLTIYTRGNQRIKLGSSVEKIRGDLPEVWLETVKIGGSAGQRVLLKNEITRRRSLLI